MTEPHASEPTPLPDALPVAKPLPRKRWVPSLVWVIPMLALLVGGGLAISAWLSQGPLIEIQFRAAEGIETGKTKIKYKDVEIGQVTALRLSADRSGVIVQARLDKSVEDLLVDDTRFWIVRPRIGAGGVSGIDTLLTGAYIGLDFGKSSESRTDFVGLETPPILTSGLPGRSFQLRADDLRSIGYGTPVYFRRLEVGRVVAYQLDQNGQGITAQVFVDAPYDQYVTTSTRFWSTSGVEVSLDAQGFRMNTESLSSVLVGGIAFGEPTAAPPAPRAAENAAFRLHPGRDQAMREPDGRAEDLVLVFSESVRGLEVGAPVDFRGIVVGEVRSIGVNYNPQTRVINVPVTVRIYPERLSDRFTGKETPTRAGIHPDNQLSSLVEAGLRGQLRLGSLLTGQLYIALDFFPKAPKVRVDARRQPRELPTVASGTVELQATVTSIANKLDAIPFQELAADLRQALQSLDKLVQQADRTLARVDDETLPELRVTLTQAQQTLATANRTLDDTGPLKQDLRETLQEVRRAASSLRTLSDYIERHPEALLRGKKEEKQ